MDSLIAAAARALAAGDPLAALQRVALRGDPPALALRGIAMAQLGEHARARELLRVAARRFGAHEAVSCARCVVAETEVALAMRELGRTTGMLARAIATLDAHGDRANAAHARLLLARRLLLLGRLPDAERSLAAIDRAGLPPGLVARAELARAELALRTCRPDAARGALARAGAAASAAGVAALQAEIAEARSVLERPAARRRSGTSEHALRLDEVAALLGTDALIVDACRRDLKLGARRVSLARRPVPFALARELACAWPGDAARGALIERVFRVRRHDESHRVRLRVELARLRALLRPLADVVATERGYALQACDSREIVLLDPPVEGQAGALVALLADGSAWSTSALAIALDTSQRTVQRALAELEAAGQVLATGNARTRRWLAPPLGGITTILLLPGTLPLQ